MNSSRITPIDPPYPPEMQAEFDKLMRGAPPLQLFRTVAQNPRVLQRMMAGGLLDKGSISLRARELMILRTTALCGAEYEWGVHVAAFALKAGLKAEEWNATLAGSTQYLWNAEDSLVLRLAETLHATNQVEDELWAELAARFRSEQLVELIMLAGLYHAVSYLVNATRVQLEGFAPRFPHRV
jgi:alkylhydroperoxidase family enzyme